MLEPDSFAVLGGAISQDKLFYSLTFKSSTFNDGKIVSCSGGPATIQSFPKDWFKPVNAERSVWCWKWKDGVSGAGRGENYQNTVAVWEIDGSMFDEELGVPCKLEQMIFEGNETFPSKDCFKDASATKR